MTPTAGLDWLDVKADASPAQVLRALQRLRREAQDEIERLISLLDTIEGDADFEHWDERELECEDEGAQCDDEGFGESVVLA